MNERNPDPTLDDSETHSRQRQRRDEPEAANAATPTGQAQAGEVQAEIEILRDELASAQRRLEEVEQTLADQEGRALRARAELDTVRRRAAADESRARDAGVDEAVLPAVAVYDDLRRALAAAESGGDPAEIVPGVRAVMDALERNLAKLDIERVGAPGERFDPDLHEALTSAPLSDGAEPGTIAEVFEAGFVRGDRLIRPARVIVYQDAQE
jgi:molecular chaperone GrpE